MKQTEQEKFGERLAEALSDAGYGGCSASLIAREFNLRFPQQRVTVHAVRKWLGGMAIPTQEKVVALSQWLGVNPAWLRFDGEAPKDAIPKNLPIEYTTEQLRLLRDIDSLSQPGKKLVQQLVDMLLQGGFTE